jgi:prepilin-type processing-associated H-X9-DG protein
VYCLNSLRKIGIAVQLYTEDNSGYLPRASMTAAMNPPMEPFKVRPWGEAIVPYLGIRKGNFSRFDADAGSVFNYLFHEAYRCPSDATHITENWTYNPSQLYLGHWSYGKNVMFEYNQAWGPKYADFSKIDKLRKPSEIVLFGEIAANQMSDHLMVDAWLDDGSNTTVDATRHRGMSNYIFCDTHATPAAFRDMFNPQRGINHFDPNLNP